MARRGRRLTIEWAAGDDAASLRARYRPERQPDVRPRLQGLWLLRAGRSAREVAQSLGGHERPVQRWVGWDRAGGPAGAVGRHAGGPGAPAFLPAEQRAELAAEVATGRFRPAAEVRRWGAERWGVSYTAGGLSARLGRLDGAPTVPGPLHEKAAPAAQARRTGGAARKRWRRPA